LVDVAIISLFDKKVNQYAYGLLGQLGDATHARADVRCRRPPQLLSNVSIIHPNVPEVKLGESVRTTLKDITKVVVLLCIWRYNRHIYTQPRALMQITFDSTSGKFVAKDTAGNILDSSKNRDYLKRKLQQIGIKETPAAAVMSAAAAEFAINDRFEFTEQLVTMVATGQTASAIITGEGGLGKSYTVTKALKAAGLKDISDLLPGTVVAQRTAFRVVKGFSTAKGLYRMLFENKNSIVVLDDCDSVLKDPDALNLLKGALDSYDKRIISWNTNVADDGLPRSFQFTGGVIFISNMSTDKISQAIRSRSMNVDLSMTTDQKLERMETIMVAPEFMEGVALSMKKDALATIVEYKAIAKEISLRTLINVTKIRASGNKNWSALAKYMLCN
jgi:hypothetical protein